METVWTTNTTTIVKKAKQCLHLLRPLRKNKMGQELLVAAYRSAIEGITTWYGWYSAADRRALQRVINSARKIVGCRLPSLRDISGSCCLNRARNIIKDPSHPTHHLFDLLPSGRRSRSIRARTTRLTNSFFPWAIRTLNTNNSKL